VAAGASGEESAWHDLIANFTVEPDPASGEPPWPERENLAVPPDAGPDAGPAADPGPDTDPAMMLDLSDDPKPRIIRPASAVPPPPPAPDEENFVPPEPPPLPSLDPVAKGAWAALFGGPAYLLIATVAGWVIPGWGAFLAVAAFVGGFATLVMRMADRPPLDSGPDDGAVL
jgi:hypothetical protein